MNIPLIGSQERRNRIVNIWLLACSILFYSWGEGSYIFVMLLSSSVDYLAALVIAKAWQKGPIATTLPSVNKEWYQKFALVFSIIVNIGILGYFKYYNFGVDNLNHILSALGLNHYLITDITKVTLPLGISFYTFQSLSYTIDVYRGQATATRRYSDFICYVTLFPQLVAGPIVRYRDVAYELVHRTISSEKVAHGIVRFSFGLAKKVLIANQMGYVADQIFNIPNGELTFALSWLGVICYTFQIYFDFSGYSDMAIGMGYMLGFRFLENFNYPYLSKSVKEFWRRWHISLSTWFRDYLYIPMGGNRCSAQRHYFNLITVFFLCGLWHGAAWTFIAWGLFHGLFLTIEQLGFLGFIQKRSRVFQHLYTLLVVILGWVIFRSKDLSQAGAFIEAMFGFGKGDGRYYYPEFYLRPDIVIILIISFFASCPLLPVFKELVSNLEKKAQGYSSLCIRIGWAAARLSTVVVLFFLSALFLSSGTYNPFIYFRF